MDYWDELCGEHTLSAIRTDVRHPFDANASGVAIDLKDFTVFVFENPDDGYRSSSTAPMIAKCSMYEFGTSPEYIHAPVTIRRWTESDYGIPEGIEIIDRRNGKVVLTLGTDNTDDYYPSFRCDWHPENLAENART